MYTAATLRGLSADTQLSGRVQLILGAGIPDRSETSDKHSQAAASVTVQYRVD